MEEREPKNKRKSACSAVQRKPKIGRILIRFCLPIGYEQISFFLIHPMATSNVYALYETKHIKHNKHKGIIIICIQTHSVYIQGHKPFHLFDHLVIDKIFFCATKRQRHSFKLMNRGTQTRQ